MSRDERRDQRIELASPPAQGGQSQNEVIR
jgi:hypothetical protein